MQIMIYRNILAEDFDELEVKQSSKVCIIIAYEL